MYPFQREYWISHIFIGLMLCMDPQWRFHFKNQARTPCLSRTIPIGMHTVRFRKLTTSCPYGSGIGDDLLSSSHVKFYGVGCPPASSCHHLHLYLFEERSNSSAHRTPLAIVSTVNLPSMSYNTVLRDGYENYDLANTEILDKCFSRHIDTVHIWHWIDSKTQCKTFLDHGKRDGED